MKTIGFLLVGLAITAMLACSNDDNSSETIQNGESGTGQEASGDNVFLLTAEQEAKVASLNDFSFNLFRTVSNENVSTVVSPLSVAFVLGMIGEGAEGATQQEITNVLGFGTSDYAARDVSEMMKKLINGAPRVDDSVKVALANALMVNQLYRIQNSYQQTLSSYYDASVYSLDFSKPAALQTINSWCNQKTNGMISNIIDELDPETVLCLLNAIYFKGRWADPFDKNRSTGGVFFNGKSYNDQAVMSKQAVADYAETADLQALRLPFGNGKYAMTFLLPKQQNGLSSLVASLAGKTLLQLPFSKEEVVMMLPIFKTDVNFLLNSYLKDIGVKRVFEKGDEVLKIAEKDGNSVPLYVSLMIQKTQLGVDEEGSEGAAVTIAEMNLFDGPDDSKEEQSIKKFIATHPFVYLISELSSGTVFFVGQFCGQ